MDVAGAGIDPSVMDHTAIVKLWVRLVGLLGLVRLVGLRCQLSAGSADWVTLTWLGDGQDLLLLRVAKKFGIDEKLVQTWS